MSNMLAATKYCDLHDKTKGLSTDDCLSIMRSPNPDLVSAAPPERPKAGELFVFKSKDPDTGVRMDDYKCDLYFWMWHSQHNFPSKNARIKKITYNIRLSVGGESSFSSGFQRIVVEPLVSGLPFVLVMYVGDESLAPRLNPNHGNRKRGQRPHVPQAPSLKDTILRQYHGQMPSTLYQQMGGQARGNEAVFTPRDIEKVRNVIKQAKRAGRISNDALSNLYELSTQLPGDFVSHLRLIPSLVCHLVHRPFYQEIKDVLALPRGSFDKTPYFSYDTTFQVGDFYLSMLVFRHTYFVNNPVFPVAYMLHDRKYHADHEEFVSRILSDLVPASSSPVAIVTDREFAFSTLPNNVKQVYCWRHIFENVLRTVPAGGVRSPGQIAGDVQNLLKAESLQSFQEQYAILCVAWTAPFRAYFEKNLKQCLIDHAARWVLEEVGVYNPISGVTTNVSESMNARIQRLIDWRERPIDVAVLFFYHLSKYYDHEISRGKHGLGEYLPKPGYDVLPLEMMPERETFVVPPDQLVDFLQNPGSLDPQDSVADDAGPSQVESPASAARNAMLNSKSRFAMAKNAILSKKVGCDFNTGAWVVNEGEKPKIVAFGVRLQPDKCACGASQMCYHIMAARMAAGLPVNANDGKSSLSKLYKGAKLRADRRSGRKKPRQKDHEPEASAGASSETTSTMSGVNQPIPASMIAEIPDDGVLVMSMDPNFRIPPAKTSTQEQRREIVDEADRTEPVFKQQGNRRGREQPLLSLRKLSKTTKKKSGLPQLNDIPITLPKGTLSDSEENESNPSEVSGDPDQDELVDGDGEENDEEAYFKEIPCSFNRIRLSGSGGVSYNLESTEALDSFLVIFWSAMSDNPYLLSILEHGSSTLEHGSNGSGKALSKCLHLLLTGDHWTAKEPWVAFLVANEVLPSLSEGHSPNAVMDIGGSQYDIFAQFFEQALNMAYFSACSNGDNCPDNLKKISKSLSKPSKDADGGGIEEQLKNQFAIKEYLCELQNTKSLGGNLRKECTKSATFLDETVEPPVQRRIRVCNGIREDSEHHFVVDSPCLIFSVSEYTRDECLQDLPGALVLGDKTFYLRGLTVHHPLLNYLYSYQSYIMHDEFWYFYDSYDKKAPVRIDPKTINYAQNPSFAVYTI